VVDGLQKGLVFFDGWGMQFRAAHSRRRRPESAPALHCPKRIRRNVGCPILASSMRGQPDRLAFLQAVSSSHAVGMWQFRPPDRRVAPATRPGAPSMRRNLADRG